MSDNLFRLAQRIRSECDELGRVVDRAQEAWRRALRSPDDLYLDSVALNLHGFYAGLERLFEMIVGVVDGQMPRGENWHRILLEQGVPVIENVANLDQLPPTGFVVIALPLKIRAGSGSPVRVVALV